MVTPPPLPSLSDQEARTQRHLEYLDTLIAQGMDLAARLHQQSTTPSDLCSALAAPGIAVPFITPDVIAAFAQINQTIRRAILVARKLAEPLPLAPTRKRNSNDAQDQTRRGPESAQAETTQAETTQAETIRAECGDRLHSPDLEDRIGSRPIPEIIAGLCRDLNVHMDPEHAEAPDAQAPDIQAPGAQAAQPIGSVPSVGHRPRTRQPTKSRIELADHDSGSIATILASGNIRDG